MSSKKTVDFHVKACWLAISKMYNTLGGEYKITHSTGFVLLNIDTQNGTPATKIAPLMGMEARSLSRILKNMEEDGIIFRKADEEDKRKVLICLTQKGRKQRELVRKIVKDFNKILQDAIAKEELDIFAKVLNQITQISESYRFNDWENLDDLSQDLTTKTTEANKEIILPFAI